MRPAIMGHRDIVCGDAFSSSLAQAERILHSLSQGIKLPRRLTREGGSPDPIPTSKPRVGEGRRILEAADSDAGRFVLDRASYAVR